MVRSKSCSRSLSLTHDRLHDFDRTMAVNYFGPVRLTMGLLPAMRAQRRGHVVNVVTWGVQVKAPKFAAYIASKTALDTWSRIAGRELYGDGVTFTSIHMPLVRTPMIAPTKMYDSVPTLSVDEAAELMVKAIIERPSRVATRLGIFAALVNAVAPKAYEVVMNTAFELFPDSAAAKGDRKALREAKPSQEQIAFAALMRGVHW